MPDGCPAVRDGGRRGPGQNGQTATYSVTRTTYDYSVTLIG
ncbi:MULTISPECIES: hypothetical protein [unclassified Micromonospora]|nr:MULTISPECIES: hypothetical protein [unclassified Micromonospora]